jgi:hypothetical protein
MLGEEVAPGEMTGQWAWQRERTAAMEGCPQVG